ncbi:MAG: hypothetical protein U0169_02740 [Polyangiaceae bacterium]
MTSSLRVAAVLPLVLAASTVGCFARHDSLDPGENAGSGSASVPFDFDAGAGDASPRASADGAPSATSEPTSGGSATGTPASPGVPDAGAAEAGPSDSGTPRDSGSSVVPDAGACDDSVDGVRGGYVCPSNGGAVACLDEYDCTTFARVMKPRLRDALDVCLADANGQRCFSDLVPTNERRRCHEDVVRRACDDDSAISFCRGLRASACGNLPDAGARLVGCEREVAILNDVGRREFHTCVTRAACSDEAIDECRFFYLGR